jgi:hypothetical protein
MRTVPDSARTAKFYREQAEECRRLAEITTSSEIRSYYMQIAEHYVTLANTEDIQPAPPVIT